MANMLILFYLFCSGKMEDNLTGIFNLFDQDGNKVEIEQKKWRMHVVVWGCGLAPPVSDLWTISERSLSGLWMLSESAQSVLWVALSCIYHLVVIWSEYCNTGGWLSENLKILVTADHKLAEFIK